MDGRGGPGSTATCPFRRQSIKRTFSTMANGHRSQSPSSSLFVHNDEQFDNEYTTQRPQFPSTLALPPARPRFHGDGLDFRYPVNYSSPHSATMHGNAFIDLTDDDNSSAAQDSADARSTPAAGSSRAQRLPRYTRDIIRIADEGDDEEQEMEEEQAQSEHHQEQDVTNQAPRRLPLISLLDDSSSDTIDDVEFIAERPRSQLPGDNQYGSSDGPLQANTAANHASLPDPIDLTMDADDDVIHVDTRAREHVRPAPPFLFEDFLNHNTHFLRRQFISRVDEQGQFGEHDDFFPDWVEPPRTEQRRPRSRPRVGHARAPAHAMNRIGFVLQYENPAFDLNTGRARPRSPEYHPPPPAAEGFTRSPGEDDTVVCPNCGDELAMGDSDVKQQIWVIKACGHAYCGECAQNRAKSGRQSSKKGKARATDPSKPAPFKHCVVSGCAAPAASKSMVHVYLGS